MFGDLMVFAAMEAVVFVATALVFYGPDLTGDEIARFEAAGEEARKPLAGPGMAAEEGDEVPGDEAGILIR